MKKIAVGNMGEEELERVQRVVMTRDDTRAEADLLFDGAKDMRKTDRGMLEKLFVQTPASVTMAPNLQKSASAAPYTFMKLASMLECGPNGSDNWLSQFEGSPLMAKAIALEEQSLQFQQEDMQRRLEDDVRYQQQDTERKAHWQKNDKISLQKRVLALELAKEKAGLTAQPEAAPEGEEVGPQEEAAPEQLQEQALPSQVQKTASITPRVDAFFEKLAAPSDAQRRYPELMKVAASGTKKVPNLKPRVTTELSGPTPVRASISGGSA